MRACGERPFPPPSFPSELGRLIIENGVHAETRRTASIAYEIGHILLEHQFTETILTLDNCRSVSEVIEEEADRLGGELLVPFQVALMAARAGWSDQDVADFYAVSPVFAAMRMNLSGARKIAMRQRNAYRRVAGVPRLRALDSIRHRSG